MLVSPGIFLHRDSVEHRPLARRLAAFADVVTLDIRGHGDSGGAFTLGRARAGRRGGGRGRPAAHATIASVASASPSAATTWEWRRPGTGRSTPSPSWPPRRNLFLLDHNFLTAGLLRSVPLILRRRRRRTRVALPFRPPPSLARVVDRIAPTPLLIAHGSADWLIPPRHAHELFARAGEPKSLVMIERGLHAENILVDEPEPLFAALQGFFESRL